MSESLFAQFDAEFGLATKKPEDDMFAGFDAEFGLKPIETPTIEQPEPIEQPIQQEAPLELPQAPEQLPPTGIPEPTLTTPIPEGGVGEFALKQDFPGYQPEFPAETTGQIPYEEEQKVMPIETAKEGLRRQGRHVGELIKGFGVVDQMTADKNIEKAKKNIEYYREKGSESGVKIWEDVLKKHEFDKTLFKDIEKAGTKVAEKLPASEKFKKADGVKGFAQDYIMGLTQIPTTVAATMLGTPAAGAAWMGSQIAGGKYSQLVEQGVEPARALEYGIVDAVLQAPLEQIGLGKIMKAWKPGKVASKAIKEIVEAGATEFITEGLQTYPEAITEIWATTEGKSNQERVDELVSKLWDITKDAGYQATIGGLIGATAAGPGGLISTTKGDQVTPPPVQEPTVADLEATFPGITEAAQETTPEAPPEIKPEEPTPLLSPMKKEPTVAELETTQPEVETPIIEKEEVAPEIEERKKKRRTLQSVVDEEIKAWVDEEIVTPEEALDPKTIRLAEVAADKTARNEVTGLPSKAHKHSAIDKIFKERAEDEEVLMVQMDQDYFKAFNDSYGHIIGDDVLKQSMVPVSQLFESIGFEHFHESGDENSAITKVKKADYANKVKEVEKVKTAIENTEIILPNGSAVPLSMTLAMSNDPNKAEDLLAKTKENKNLGRNALGVDEYLKNEYNISERPGIDVKEKYIEAGLIGRGVTDVKGKEVSTDIPVQREGKQEPRRPVEKGLPEPSEAKREEKVKPTEKAVEKPPEKPVEAIKPKEPTLGYESDLVTKFEGRKYGTVTYKEGFDQLSPKEQHKALAEEKRKISAQIDKNVEQNVQVRNTPLRRLKAELGRAQKKVFVAKETKIKREKDQLDRYAKSGKPDTILTENVQQDVETVLKEIGDRDLPITELNKLLSSDYDKKTLQKAVDAIKKGNKDGTAAMDIRKEIGGYLAAGTNPDQVADMMGDEIPFRKDIEEKPLTSENAQKELKKVIPKMKKGEVEVRVQKTYGKKKKAFEKKEDALIQYINGKAVVTVNPEAFKKWEVHGKNGRRIGAVYTSEKAAEAAAKKIKGGYVTNVGVTSVFHEAAHAATPGVLKSNPKLHKRLTKIFNAQKNSSLVAAIKESYKKEIEADPDVLFNEYIAHSLEYHLANPHKKGAAYQVWKAIKEFLINIGVSKDSVDDVINSMAKQMKRVKDVKAGTKAKPLFKKDIEEAKPKTETKEFKKWFGDSKVVDEDGKPLVVYHGTGTDITEFKEEFTGKGNDQFGSGFYFTTDPDEAGAYQTNRIRDPQTGELKEKLGGEDKPTVVPAYLSIKNPILVAGSNLRDSALELTHAQAKKIIGNAPNIMHPEESPLGDWIDTYWDEGPKKWMIDQVAESYTGPSLLSLENDFYGDDATAFRKAVKEATGHDGVIQDFENGKKHYIAWFPTQIKHATKNLGTFSETDPSILKKKDLDFYSPTERTISDLKQEKGVVPQISSMIRKGQLKKAEVEWMGLEEFLKENPKATKSEVLDFVRANEVEVEESDKGVAVTVPEETLDYVREKLEQSGEFKQEDIDDWLEYYDAHRQTELYGALWDIGETRALNEITEDEGFEDERQTKYSQYTLPGGENYREMLFKMPERENQPYVLIKKSTGKNIESFPNRDAAFDHLMQINKDKTDYMIMPQAKTTDKYKSSHWDEPNVFAHARVNDRTTPDGEKVLFVEEIQSDQARDIRERGVKGERKKPKKTDVEAVFVESVVPEGHDPKNYSGYWETKNKATGGLIVRAPGNYSKQEALDEGYKFLMSGYNIAESAAVPDFPFKKNYHEFVLKKLLRKATEEGYDRIAWISGEQTADRYDLSKQVDMIGYDPSTKILRVFKGDEQLQVIENVTEKNIGEYIGKDAGKKIVDQSNEWLGNLPEPDSVREQFYDFFGFDHPSSINLTPADGSVISMLHNDKVRRAVISNLPVDVVDNLKSLKISPQKLLSDKSVISDVLAVPEGLSILKGVVSALRKVHAGFRTKLLTGYSGGVDVDLLPALKASNLTTSEVLPLAFPNSFHHLGKAEVEKGFTPATSTTKTSFTDDSGKTITATLADFLDWHNNKIYGRQPIKQPLISITGDDLKVSPQWAKNLYDKTIPNYLKKYTKKWGGKVEVVKLPTGEENDQGDVKIGLPREQLSIPITEQMKQGVMEGQPLFKKDIEKKEIDLNTIPEETFSDKVIQQVQDKMHRGWVIKKALMPDVTDELDFMEQQELIHSKTKSKMDEFKDVHYTPLLKAMGAYKISVDELGDFLYAKHAAEANEHVRSIRPKETEDFLTEEEMALLNKADKLGGRKADLQASLKTEQLTDKEIESINEKIAKVDKQIEDSASQIEGIDKSKVLYTVAGSGMFSTTADKNRMLGLFANDSEMVKKIEKMPVAEEIINKAKEDKTYKKLENLAKKVYTITSLARNELVESGRISKEQKAAWEKYDYYVPLKGIGEEPTVAKTGKGLSSKEASKRRLGRISKAQNILSNIVVQVNEGIINNEKNKVGQTFLNFVRQNPAPDLWEIDRAVKKPTFNKSTGEVVYRPDMSKVYKDPETGNLIEPLRVWEKGEEYDITIKDPALARGMVNMGAEKTGKVLQTFAAFNRYIALINTSLSPGFIPTNFTRDIQTMALNISAENSAKLAANIIKDVPKAVYNIGASLEGLEGVRKVTRKVTGKKKPSKAESREWMKWYEEFKAAGGKVEFFGLEDTDLTQKRMMREMSLMKGGPKSAAIKMARGAKDLVMAANEAVENGTRLAVYVNLRREGVSKQKAAYAAKNITVNFNKKGELGVYFNAFYIFSNASIQGAFRLAQALKTKRGKQIAGGIVVGSVALAQLARFMGGEDDDEINFYDKIPDHVKTNNIVIMRPGIKTLNRKGFLNKWHYIKIPVPYGYNIFHAAGQAIDKGLHNRTRKGITEAVGMVGSALSNTFNPLGSSSTIAQTFTPTMGRLFADLGVNKDFAGRPIVIENKYGVPKAKSYGGKRSTSNQAKMVAKFTNYITGGSEYDPGIVDISPEHMDYVVGYLTGSAGRAINQSASMLMNIGSKEDTPVRAVPVVRRFFGEIPEYQATHQFYTNLKKMETKEAEFKKLLAFEPTEAPAYYKKNKKYLNMILTKYNVAGSTFYEYSKANEYRKEKKGRKLERTPSEVDKFNKKLKELKALKKQYEKAGEENKVKAVDKEMIRQFKLFNKVFETGSK